MSNGNEIRKLESAKQMKQTMGDYFARLKEAAASPDKKVAWCTSAGPAELLYAMGFEVFFPENHSAMIGALKKAADYIPITVAHGYSPDICSYLTSDIGAFLKKQTPLTKMGFNSVPKPDILVFNTNQCREVVDWFDFYAKHFNAPIIGIRTPLNVDEVSPSLVQYISGQYQELVPLLQPIATQKFDLDKFKETVRLSHEACTLWRKVLETAKHHPSPINFFDASIHMGPIVVMRGTRYALDYYRVLLAELEERITNNVGAVANEKYRLYWEGMPIWFQLKNLAKLFARLNTCIVASTYCYSWSFENHDLDKPFDSCALAYTKLFIVRSDSVKQKILEKHLKDFSVDGIIYHDAKTCPRNSNNRYGLQVRLQKENNMPYLELNGDLNDSRCYSEEQSVVAIETFIDQLAMRK